MPQFCEKLLIIGAGPVGLGMAAALKARGVTYDQVDAGDGIGGNWRHGVYADVHLVSSKTSTAYADYPMPAHYPDFPSAAQMLSYLEDYARHKGLLGRIETAKAVYRATPKRDDSWHVQFTDGEERHYKGLVICNGHHWCRKYPTYRGRFTGTYIHSKDYKCPADLAGKRVLVIGGGNSGCEISCEAAKVAACSDLSLRGGQWFLPKTVAGKPLTDLALWRLPTPLQRLALRVIIRRTFGDYRNYGLPWPDHGMFERHTSFATDLLGAIQKGRIKPRPEIERFEGKTVHFVDGSACGYDIVVAATGFHNSFPFLPKGLIRISNEVVQVYGGAFPDNVKNLYIIGSQQPRNGFGSLLTPAAELYARMIEMQEDLAHPWGYILKSHFEPLPKTQFIDPNWARIRIAIGQRAVNVSYLFGRWLGRWRPRQPLPGSFEFEHDQSGTPPLVRLDDRDAA